MARPHPDKVTDAVNAALDEIDHDDTREFRHQAAREILKKDFEVSQLERAQQVMDWEGPARQSPFPQP